MKKTGTPPGPKQVMPTDVADAQRRATALSCFERDRPHLTRHYEGKMAMGLNWSLADEMRRSLWPAGYFLLLRCFRLETGFEIDMTVDASRSPGASLVKKISHPSV